PAAIVNFDYQNLRKYGRVERVAIGARMQNITPTLAAGLGLARSWGAIVSDMEPGGAAEAAGLQIDDIVLAIDNRPIPTLPDLMAVLYLHPADKILKIDVLRGVSRMSFNLSVKVYHENVDELSDIPDLQKSLIRKLSIFVTDLDERVRPVLQGRRSDSGVVVVAQTAGPNVVGAGLETTFILRHYALPHPFTSFSFVGIAITFWYAGMGPGLLALLLSYLAMSHFSIPNRIGGASSESYLVIYGIFGLLVSWFSSSRR